MFFFNTSLAPLAPAIAAGNCGVIKPSEISPATAEVQYRNIDSRQIDRIIVV